MMLSQMRDGHQDALAKDSDETSLAFRCVLFALPDLS
jgi:hypothetical protein